MRLFETFMVKGSLPRIHCSIDKTWSRVWNELVRNWKDTVKFHNRVGRSYQKNKTVQFLLIFFFFFQFLIYKHGMICFSFCLEVIYQTKYCWRKRLNWQWIKWIPNCVSCFSEDQIEAVREFRDFHESTLIHFSRVSYTGFSRTRQIVDMQIPLYRLYYDTKNLNTSDQWTLAYVCTNTRLEVKPEGKVLPI